MNRRAHPRRVPHLSEERDIAASPEAIWRIVSDTTRWPTFFAGPREILHLHCVELLDDAVRDGPDVKRRLHVWGVPSWDEQVSRWHENESIAWLGIRNPALHYWQQQMELIPGRGFTTLRWDIYFKLSGPHPLGRAFKRVMEDVMIASLERIERRVLEEAETGEPR